jgi:hypothetical protein
MGTEYDVTTSAIASASFQGAELSEKMQQMALSVNDSAWMETTVDWVYEDKTNAGFSFEDMVLDCRYAGRRCFKR